MDCKPVSLLDEVLAAKTKAAGGYLQPTSGFSV
jgi:hypothetical protein